MTPHMRAALSNLSKDELIDLIARGQDREAALRTMNAVILCRNAADYVSRPDATASKEGE